MKELPEEVKKWDDVVPKTAVAAPVVPAVAEAAAPAAVTPPVPAPA